MVKQILLCVFLGIVSTCYSQDKEVNFIILIDGNLTQIYGENIIMKNGQGEEEVIRVHYVPGKLSVEERLYDKIMSESVGDLMLNLRYIKTEKGNAKYLSYKIEDFNRDWLSKGNYFILYIYTADYKGSRKRHGFLPGQKITYEYDWSEGSMRRVTKN